MASRCLPISHRRSIAGDISRAAFRLQKRVYAGSVLCQAYLQHVLAHSVCYSICCRLPILLRSSTLTFPSPESKLEPQACSPLWLKLWQCWQSQ